MENNQQYRNILFFKACAAVMALTDNEKRKLWEYVLEHRPALRNH